MTKIDEAHNMPVIKIEDIRRVNLNGRAVKLFKVYVFKRNAYVFAGQFSAPARTANKNLHTFAGVAYETN